MRASGPGRGMSGCVFALVRAAGKYKKQDNFVRDDSVVSRMTCMHHRFDLIGRGDWIELDLSIRAQGSGPSVRPGRHEDTRRFSVAGAACGGIGRGM